MNPHDISPLAAPILERLLEEARADERVCGVTLGGSAATGTLDEHSDLDVVIVGHDPHGAELVASLPDLAGRLGPLLTSFTGEHVGERRLLIALYGPPLLHVDLKAVTIEELADRVEDGRILWERDGTVTEAFGRTAARWPKPDPQWIEDRFWVWIHYGTARAARGEHLECIDLLAALRSMVLGPLLAQAVGARPQGVRRLERLAPDRVDALLETVGGGDRRACLAALRAAATLYDELRPSGVIQRDAARQLALEHLGALDGEARGPGGGQGAA